MEQMLLRVGLNISLVWFELFKSQPHITFRYHNEFNLTVSTIGTEGSPLLSFLQSQHGGSTSALILEAQYVDLTMCRTTIQYIDSSF